MATLRADRFAGLGGTGETTTIALTATGTQLTVTADMLARAGSSLTVSIPQDGLVSAPVQKNVTDAVVLTGLTVGKEIKLTMTMQDAVVYTVGFAQ
eukprot:COSAG01_NODE_773_length_13704_cov_9.386843_7_plen_96_part_00